MKSNDLTQGFVDKYIMPFITHNDKRMYLDTKRFSPVVYGNDRPAKGDMFHLNYKEVPYKSENDRADFIKKNNIVTDIAWWEKQHKRCMEGYIVKNATNFGEDVWIPGRMYFYLNFWPIKRSGDIDPRKDLYNPKFIDVIFEKFWLVRELSIFQKLNNMWQKRRQIGWTECSAADVGYEFTFFKNSQSVIVAGEEKYTFNFMNFVSRGLMYLSNTQFHVQVDTYRPKEYINAKYRGSEIYARTALINPEVASSLSPSLIYFEESGIWPEGHLQKAYDKVKVSLTAETDINGVTKKSGYGYILGTGGLAEDGVLTAQKMFYDPVGNGLLAFKNIYETNVAESDVACFVPALYFVIIDDNGNSLKDKSRELVEKNRESSSLDARYTYTTEMPFTPTESFMTSMAGYFGKEIIQLLNERKAFVFGNKSKIFHQKGYLKWIDPSDKFQGVEFVEDDDENWCNIFEHPVKNKDGKIKSTLYKAGTDSYDQTEAHTSTSKGSIQVFKTFNHIDDTYNIYAARITERPKEGEGGATRFYEWALMLCIYYNAINLVEYTKFLITDYFVNNNFEFLLKEKPEFFLSVYVDNTKTSNRYGIDASTKQIWLKKMREFLTPENINKMNDIDQLDALARFKYTPGPHGYNCDITISSCLCQVLVYDDMNKDEEQEDESEDYNYGVSYIMDSNGNMQQSWH